MAVITNDQKAFAKLIDSSLLNSTDRHKDYEAVCAEALHYGFACVAVQGGFVKTCAELLRGSDIRLSCAAAFPMGLSSLKTKMNETANAFEDGATDIDMVLNVSKILDGDYAYVEKEIRTITEMVRLAGGVSKFIFEICYLNNAQIKDVIKICNDIKPDFIKTGTGMQGPAMYETVVMMRRECDPAIKLKASGAARNYERMEAIIEAGADRIGTICAGLIMDQYRVKFGLQP
ncbi:MAG: deoxyribose-phosphate aldolase [Planctomycetaceae bacterium]|nr:deoxyribose-phosphate aldolase [Planctomycetaceae bacterium]